MTLLLFVNFFRTAFKIEKVVGQKYEGMAKAIVQMVQNSRAEMAEKLEQMAQNSRAEIGVLKENQRETENSPTEVALQDKVSRIWIKLLRFLFAIISILLYLQGILRRDRRISRFSR